MKFDWYRLFHPKFWMQIYPTDWAVDAIIRKRLDNYHKPMNIGRNWCRLDDIEVWISNYPYAFGRIKLPDNPYSTGVELLPSASTRAELYRHIKATLKSQSDEKRALEMKLLEKLK